MHWNKYNRLYLLYWGFRAVSTHSRLIVMPVQVYISFTSSNQPVYYVRIGPGFGTSIRLQSSAFSVIY